MFRKVSLVALLTVSTFAYGQPAWYRGEINRVWPYEKGGGFIITFKSTQGSPSSLSDCEHKYVYFKSSELQPEQLSNSYSTALAAFHSGTDVGVVIDKSLNGTYCYAKSIDIRK